MPNQKMVKQNVGALKIAFIYLVLGGLWILFSDKVAEALAPDRGTLTIISVLKGWGFVIATTILLYGLIQSYTSELQEGDERFRKAFRAVPLGLAITRASDGAYIDANAAYSKITGFSLEELTGQTSLGLNMITPEQRQEYTHLMSEQGFIHNKEMLLKNKSGQFRSVFGSMEIVELNHEVCVLSTAIDVTDRKQTEDALRASEYNYRSILEQASDGIFIADASGKYIEVNPSGCAMLGYTRAEILEKKMSDLIPPEDLTTVPVRMEELKQAKVFLSERRLICKDGTLLPVEISARMLSDGRFQGILRNISERKQVEEALRESEDKFKYVFENSMIGKSITLLSGEIKPNQALCDMFGYSEAELINKKWQEITHPDDIELTRREIDQLLSGVKVSTRFFKRYIHKNGSVVWADLSSSLRRDKDGKPLYLITSVVDITERKQAEEALRHSEESLRLAALAGHMGTWDRDFVSGQLNWSSECRAMFGVASDVEVNDERFMQVLHPEDRVPVGLLINDALEKQIDFNTEYRVIWPDGTLHWIAAQGQGYYNENGRAIRMTGVTFDITQRKQVEEAIRESEERLRLSLRAANQGLYDLNVQTGETIVNPEYAQMLGYDPQTFVETNAAWVERLHPDDHDITAKAYADYINGLTPEYRVEFRQRMNDGNWKWILSLGKIVETDKAGKPLRMLGTHTDISIRKQTEMRLAERNATLNAILESSSAPVFSLDCDYQYTSFNKAHAAVMQALYGAKIEIGKSMLEYQVVEEDRKESLKNLKRALLGEQVIESAYSGEPGRSRRFFEITHNPIRESSGNIIGVSVFVSDITERKHAEEEIRQLNETLEERIAERTTQLESANKELESFSYSISHDLRSPLRGIDGWSLALLEDYGSLLDERGKSHIQQVRSETQRMGELIDSILNLSRITRSEMNKENVNLSAIAEIVVARLQETKSENRKIEFVIQKGLTVMGDAKLLDVVLTNLIGNAFKFTGKKEEAYIEFGQTSVESKPAYFVRDNGAGFDMTYAKKLFGVFQRMHRAAEFPGTGVGLATVRRIIERHGGSIWAASDVGQGSTFYFTLENNNEK